MTKLEELGAVYLAADTAWDLLPNTENARAANAAWAAYEVELGIEITWNIPYVAKQNQQETRKKQTKEIKDD